MHHIKSNDVIKVGLMEHVTTVNLKQTATKLKSASKMALLSRKEKRLTASYSNKHEISSADIKNIIKEGCERRTGKS